MKKIGINYNAKKHIFAAVIFMIFLFCSLRVSIASPPLKEIAFGFTGGDIFILDLSNMKLARIATQERGPHSYTTGLAFFPFCKKLVFFVHGDPTSYVSTEVGILDLTTGKVDYWDTSKIGLGSYIVERIYLSATDPNLVYGHFSDTVYGMQPPDQNAEEFIVRAYENYKKSIKTGSFNVCDSSWKPVATPSLYEMKIFPGKIGKPWINKYKDMWQVIKKARLATDSENDELLWADENYILFTSFKKTKKKLMVGHIVSGQAVIDKAIDTRLYTNINLLNPGSSVFIY